MSCLEELVRTRKFSGVSHSAARVEALSEDVKFIHLSQGLPSLILEKFVTFH